MRTDLADRLSYVSGESASPLPDWARDLIQVGENVSARAGATKPVMAVLSLPVRAFAAVLTSTGAIVHRVTDPQRVLSVDDHFHRVASKSAGTAVTVTRGTRLLMGLFLGTEDRDGTSYLLVRLTGEGGGNETIWVHRAQCHRVQLRPEPYELTDRRASKKASRPTRFLIDCLDELPASTLVKRARTDCVLRGHVSVLETELRDHQFQVNAGRVGTLAQILRPKRFVPQGTPHRSIILPLGDSLPSIDSPDPPVLVFDGALSFLKGSKHVPAYNSIIILDRTEPRYNDAVDGILALLRTRGNRCEPPDALATIPRGLELLLIEVDI